MKAVFNTDTLIGISLVMLAVGILTVGLCIGVAVIIDAVNGLSH